MIPVHLFFGWPTGGVWSNLVASAICSVAVYLRMHAKLKATHQALSSQAERHKTELSAQATAHQNELKQQAARQHEQAQAAAEARHEDLKAHVATALAKPRGRS